MRFFLNDHQGKGRRYAEALVRNGWEQCELASAPGLDLALYDHDFHPNGCGRPDFPHFDQNGTAIILYPHAARPHLWWDGMYPIYPRTRMAIVPADGHVEVMQTYGYPKPVEVCGWAMCEQQPFKPRNEVRGTIRVLFMPIHPNNNGWMHDALKGINAITLTRLLETPDIEITIRHIKRLDLSGIWIDPRARYILANPNGSTEEIDAADVVVAHQTAAYLAVARGKPLIMIGDDIRPHSGNRYDALRWARHWEQYRELMRYPLEIERAIFGRQVRELLERAVSEDAGAAWREKFIGQPLDDRGFSKTIERYVFGGDRC